YSLLERQEYEMRSGTEILQYLLLGLVCGVLGFAFVRLLHFCEAYFQGRREGRLSAWLGRLPLPARVAFGGALVGVMAVASPVVWGTGHDFVNLANAQKLGFLFLLGGCVLKLVATSVTIGSGGSGGTF